MQQNTIPHLTDADYELQALRQNEPAVMQAVYHRNYPKIEKYVLKNNGSSEEARDIFQEAFIALWRNIQLNRFEVKAGKSIDDYLFMIARNKWIDHLRSMKRTVLVSMNEHMTESEELPVPDPDENRISQVRKSMMDLGPNCREILKRFYYYRQSVRQIAADLNYTEASAKNIKYRCMQQLKQLIKNDQ